MKHLKLLMLLLLAGCSKSKTAYETTILVQNWHGNPLANQEVHFYTALFNGGNPPDTTQMQQTLRTDATGKVVFNYELAEAGENIEYATIYVREQPLLKRIHFVRHSGPSQNKSEKKTFRVQMDSLMNLKMRVVKTDTAQTDWNIVFRQPYQPDTVLLFNDVYREKLGIWFYKVGRMDTIINRLILKNATTRVSWRTETQLVNAQQYQDSLMTIRF